MKKLLSIFVLFFAVTLSANAQTNKQQPQADKQQLQQTPEQHAKQDTADVTQVIGIDGDMQQALYQLFLKKYTELNTSKLTEEGKKQLSDIIDNKLRSTLSDEQITKLQATGLYNKLIK